MSEYQMNVTIKAPMKAIVKLHQSFKSKLVNWFIKGVAPFESYRHLKE